MEGSSLSSFFPPSTPTYPDSIYIHTNTATQPPSCSRDTGAFVSCRSAGGRPGLMTIMSHVGALGLDSLCGATTMTIDIDLKDATTGLCVSASSLLLRSSAGLAAGHGLCTDLGRSHDTLPYLALDGATATTVVCCISLQQLCCALV